MNESDLTTPSVTEPLLRETLRLVNDPEIDCNIVDLGLIYDIRFEAGTGTVFIKMTLTTPGCPMHESIAWGVQNALMQVEGVRDAQVEIVWDPPWNPSRISDYGKARLGITE
jgi:metal-sulfur cluster biosynthetic enzyme